MKIRLFYASIISNLIVLFFVGKGFAQQQDSFPQTLQRILPAIVKVIAETKVEFAGQMMGEVLADKDNRLYSIGTGFFISKDGNVMTANHVISVATGPISILYQENNKFIQIAATILFSDTLSDIAVLKVKKENCPYLQLLDPINVQVGTDLAFIGFPLDYNFPIVSKSVLSAKVDLPLKNRYPSRHQIVINQFVNHGNSGGPLFLAATGQVIGVVSWRPSPNYENRLIKLPKNYSPVIQVGGMDPIRLSVDTYNENLKYIGEISQFGIGFVPSVEYAKQFIK